MKPVETTCGQSALTSWSRRIQTLPEIGVQACDTLGAAKYVTDQSFPVFETLDEYIGHDAQVSDANGKMALIDRLLLNLLAIAPFHELLDTASGHLVSLTATPQNTQDAATQIRRLLDVMALAMAEETIMSGAPVLNDLSARVDAMRKAGAVGFKDETPPASPAKKLLTHVCGSKTGGDEAAFIRCVLERNPAMLANVLLVRVRDSVLATVATPAECIVDAGTAPCRIARAASEKGAIAGYETAYHNAYIGAMAKLFPDLDWHNDGAGVYGFVHRRVNDPYVPSSLGASEKPDAGWYFKMARTGGAPWYTVVPSAFEIDRQFVHYRPQADQLAQTRQRALNALDRYAEPTGTSRTFAALVASQEALETLSLARATQGDSPTQ
jgi:hypothetical protein